MYFIVLYIYYIFKYSNQVFYSCTKKYLKLHLNMCGISNLKKDGIRQKWLYQGNKTNRVDIYFVWLNQKYNIS